MWISNHLKYRELYEERRELRSRTASYESSNSRRSESLNLLMLCPYFFPEANAAAARAMSFAKYFTIAGAEVQVMVPNTDRIAMNVDFRGIPINRIETYDSLREQIGVISSAIRLPALIESLRLRIKTLGPDLVMTTTPSPFFAFEGHLACKRLGIPVVLDVRDAWAQLIRNHPSRLDNFVKRMIEGRCCWAAERILVVTDMLADLLVQEHRLPREKFVLAPNGADLDSFNLRGERDIDMIFSGAPSTYRNLEEVFRILSRVIKRRPSTSIIFIGWVQNDYTRKLESLAAGLDIVDNIRLMPPVAHDQVPSVLARAKIGLITLGDEAFYRPSIGAKTYEYMAAGLALACLGPSGDSELRRLVQSTRAGFYESSVQRFAERLDELLSSENMLSMMSKNSTIAASQYDRKAIAMKIYQEVLVPTIEKI